MSRYLAAAFAVSLGLGETIINSGHWQFAPLWVIAFAIVALLLVAFVKTRSARHVPLLTAAWGLAAGVFYMALYVSIAPELSAAKSVSGLLVVLMRLMLAASVCGLALSVLAHYRLPVASGGQPDTTERE